MGTGIDRASAGIADYRVDAVRARMNALSRMSARARMVALMGQTDE
jgi:hypothetical protein